MRNVMEDWELRVRSEGDINFPKPNVPPAPESLAVSYEIQLQEVEQMMLATGRDPCNPEQWAWGQTPEGIRQLDEDYNVLCAQVSDNLRFAALTGVPHRNRF